MLPLTARLYLEDAYCFGADATVVAVRENAIAVDQTCFYPGGGGQPPDTGLIRLTNGSTLEIVSAQADAEGVIWHVCATPLPSELLGQSVRLNLNQDRRRALMRYHTVLHILNTITLRDYEGWITGVQMAEDYARIDFKLDHLSPALCADLEHKVNTALEENHAVRAFYILEDEFHQRPDLLRTLEAKPPIIDGRVRVVEIVGFDAQACGGTHVKTTAEVGHFTIFRTENKGKINKRLYVRLE